MNALDGVIQQLESRKAAIDKALAALREGVVSGVSAPATRPPNSKRSAGQKARWAARFAAEASAPKQRKGRITPEGRKRLAEAMKRRWAAKRTAAQAKKRVRSKAA
jgi:hypothetical protein